MHKVWAVLRREFIERIRAKSFWIMALLGPVFFAAVFLVPVLLQGSGGAKRLVVVDRTTTGLGARVAARLDSTRRFTVVARLSGGSPNVEDSLTRAVGLKEIDGFLLVSDSLTQTGRSEYRASNVSSFEDIALLRSTLGLVAERARLEQAGVDPAVVARAQIRMSLETRKITRGRTTEESAGQSFSLAYFMMLILYIALLLYGVQVMGSVIEEKSSRIVEVLVSSLRPFQLLLGKLLGVGAVSLVQFAIWGVSGRLLLSRRTALMSRMAGGGQDVGQVFQVPHVSGSTLLIFICFFLGGFFLYSAMFAAVAATCSTEQEARQSQVPITILIMIAFFGSLATLGNPESPLAVTLSLVPFTSPIATPARWAAGNLSPVDVVTSLVLLIGGAIVVTWIAARIYRVGILMTGKRPGLRELARWVRAA